MSIVKLVPADPENEPDFGYLTTVTDGKPDHLTCPDCAADYPRPWYGVTSYRGADDGYDISRPLHCEDCGVMILPGICLTCRDACRCISYHDLEEAGTGNWPLCTCEHRQEMTS